LFKVNAEFGMSKSQKIAVSKLQEGLTNGLLEQVLLGITGSGKTFSMANLIANLDRPALIMAPNKTLAAQIYSEMRGFFPENAVEYFVSYYDYYQPEAYIPSADLFIEKDAAINEHVQRMRLAATASVLDRKDTIIVATVSAIYGLGDPEDYAAMVLHMQKNMKLKREDVLAALAAMMYVRNDYEFERSSYRVRGDVIDIHPSYSENLGIRVRLFDDEVEGIWEFDPLTGSIIASKNKVSIYPATHYIAAEKKIKKIIAEINHDLALRLEELKQDNKLIELQRLEQRVKYDIEMFRELGYCNGVENYSKYLSGRESGTPPPTLLDYLSKDTILVLDESHVMIPQLGAMYAGDRARKENLVNYGFRLPSALDNRPLNFNEFAAFDFQKIYVSATPGKYEKANVDTVVDLVVRPTGLLDPQIIVRPVGEQVDDLVLEAKKRIAKNERVLVTTLTKKMAEKLTDYLTDLHIKARYLHSDVGTVERVEILRDLRLGAFDVLVGINLLREGLDLPEVSLVAIFDADKEGFLRSNSSLIQTIGRAARNINGIAILYADRITAAMQYAIDETNRRRTIQQEYNDLHNITPQSIKKSIVDMVSSLTQEHEHKEEEINEVKDFLQMDQKKLDKKLSKMKKDMQAKAKSLEFEEASKLRDTIKKIEDNM
jgi:excinuclease ABC subunit B